MRGNHRATRLLEKKASFYVYNDIFRGYKIGVEPPRADTCNYCDETATKMKAAKMENDEDQIRQLTIVKAVHLRRSKAAHAIRKVYEKDNDPSLVAIVIDLQQTLPTPRLSTSVQYYKRKMWTYNFCIHNLKTGAAHFYVWNEKGQTWIM